MAGILDAVKKGFSVAAKSLGLVLVLIVFNMIGNLLSLPFAVAPGATVTPQLTAGALVFSIVFILVSVFFQGATLGLVRDVVKEGKMKLASFASYGLKYYLRLFGLGLLIILMIAAVALIAGLIIAVTAPLNNAIVTTIAVVIAITIGVITSLFYFLPFMLSPYALICDDSGIIAAMKKSLRVARTPFTKVLWLLVLLIIIVLISLGLGFIVGFLAGLIAAVLPAAAGRVLMAVATSVVNGYLGVVMTTSFIVFYLGLANKEKGAV